MFSYKDSDNIVVLGIQNIFKIPHYTEAMQLVNQLFPMHLHISARFTCSYNNYDLT